MSLSLPSPSRRLLRAATAEHGELKRHREALVLERDKLLSELRRLDDGLATVDERMTVLAQLIELPPLVGPLDAAATSEVQANQPLEVHERRPAVRGPAIRELAVRVLIDQPGQVEALHYRRWYELLRGAGYTIAGKDPLAVFLTQVSRSPVVRKATASGVYEVDRQAPLRIRQRLERLQAELREVAVAPPAPIELANVRARRHELDLAISQQERALEEAVRVLRRGDPDVVPLTSAGVG